MKSILGSYEDAESATAAVRALQDAHYEADEIAVTEVSGEQRRQLIIETLTEERKYGIYGAVFGVLLYGLVVVLLETGVIVDPGVGFVSESAAVTLGRTVFMGGVIGALTGCILGLGFWRLHLRAPAEVGELEVAIRVSERRLDEMKTIFERSGARRVDIGE